jgi:hypothetical protein
MADDRGVSGNSRSGDVAVDMSKIREAEALVGATEARHVTLRFLGGAAIAMHCGMANRPHREFSDLDAITRRSDLRGLTHVLEERGYGADRRFNTVNAGSRLIFYGPEGKLDVFVDVFEMCHRISLVDRLRVDTPTLSVTDLLITKLQVVELNEKDIADLTLLLDNHGVEAGEGDHVNSEYLGRLLGADWGLWRTVTNSLARMREAVPRLGAKLTALEGVATDAPRSLRFRLRGLVGERTRWYEEPEEVDDGA